MNDRLDAPGAGVPAGEARLLGWAIKFSAYFTSPYHTLRVMKETADSIGRKISRMSEEDRRKPVLIRRLTGLEDSSRSWSAYMTVAHINIVDAGILNIIKNLQQGISEPVDVDVAAVKPPPDSGAEVMDELTESAAFYEEILQNGQSLKTKAHQTHPWFGEMNARQWLLLAGLHRRLHKVQIAAIHAAIHQDQNL